MKNRSWSVFLKKYGILFVCLIVIVIGVVYWIDSSHSTRAGLDYLSAQKKKDTETIKRTLADRDIQELQMLLDEGKIQIYDMFKDFMILGDSRVVGFETYGFFPANNVYAGAGYTIKNIEEALSIIQERQPKNIFLSFGVNDMGLNIGENEGEPGYDAVYEKEIKKILEVDPNANIYVNSIIPATPAAIERAPRWNKVDQFNAKIKSMCEKNGWTYIDNSALADGGNAAIYQADGIHYLPDFYEVWTKNMYDQKLKSDALKSGDNHE